MRRSHSNTKDIEEFFAQLKAARAGSRESLGNLLDDYRAYLLLVANQELDPGLRSRGGASDLVQETITKAFCGFEGFQGKTPEEWKGWLRRILVNQVSNFVRSHVET